MRPVAFRALLYAGAMCACAVVPIQSARPISIDNTRQLPRGVELIADPEFQAGFQIKDPVGAGIVGILRTPSQSSRSALPAWQLAQWHSRSRIEPGAPVKPCAERLEAGMWCWSNSAKRIAAGGGELILSVDSMAEWKNEYRNNQEFPHLLVEQDIARSRPSPSLDEMSALRLSFNYSLLVNNQFREQGAGYNRDRHATQFLLYLMVQDLRSQRDHGQLDYVWLGVPLFDDRLEFIPHGTHVDRATEKLIWTIDQREFMRQSILKKPEQHVEIDVLPHAKRALEYAFSRKLILNKSLHLYKIGGMNVGYEMPGMGLTSIRIGKISLVSVPKTPTSVREATPIPQNAGLALQATENGGG
jgi:hypothetical protein